MLTTNDPIAARSARAYKAARIVGILEQICQELELSPAQHDEARRRYEAVGTWLADAEHPLLRNLLIYPQGSVPLGTTVRPRRSNEYDVDLVSFVPGLSPNLQPATLKRAIGDRLRANAHYAHILEEKPRCWRISYANEFHLDITPSITNPQCNAGGELVPDRQVSAWKPSNPKGYRALFEYRASLQPRWSVERAAVEAKAAEVEPFPDPMRVRGVLRRSVQLAKRHRDIFFERVGDALAPISIIITTLASRSYEWCVGNNVYDTEFDLLNDMLEHMPFFVGQQAVGGRTMWFIWNETTEGENFAEKWNVHPELAEAFFDWHRKMCFDLGRLLDAEGLDRFTRSLTESFGPSPVSKVMNSLTDEVTRARQDSRLFVSPGTGLSIGTGVGPIVRPNSFFGAE